MTDPTLTPGPTTQPKPPSPPWYGGISTALLGLMVVILLTYTLLDWDWQQELGAWNYAAVGVLIVVTSALMKNWRADLARNEDAPDGAATGGAAPSEPRPAARTPSEQP
jgi:hypothetical protein